MVAEIQSGCARSHTNQSEQALRQGQKAGQSIQVLGPVCVQFLANLI